MFKQTMSISFNPKFYLGAGKQQVADALNPFQHLQPQLVSTTIERDDPCRDVSVSCQELQTIERGGDRSEHQDEPDSKSEKR